jgi:hypothetical protein
MRPIRGGPFWTPGRKPTYRTLKEGELSMIARFAAAGVLLFAAF